MKRFAIVEKEADVPATSRNIPKGTRLLFQADDLEEALAFLQEKTAAPARPALADGGEPDAE